MDPIEIIRLYYPEGTPLYDLFMRHARQVTRKSLELASSARHLNPDTDFIREAAMLHDIGMFMTRAPEIHCRGTHPYIRHGILGRQLLEKQGLPRHAMVCERHTGAGITRQDIIDQQLPVPVRDMVPVTLEEIIICTADKFYSKRPGKSHAESPVTEIADELGRLSPGHGRRFTEWIKLLCDPVTSPSQSHTARSGAPV